MTLLRTAQVLHLADNDGNAICGAEITEQLGKVTDDDLLCGLCRDVLEQADPTITFDAEPAATDALLEFVEGRLSVLQYDQYLDSRHWQRFREIALDHYGFKCAVCGTKDDLEVHHRSYARRGRERLADVTVLCGKCHATHHRLAS